MFFVADLSEWQVTEVLVVVEWTVWGNIEVQRRRSRWPRAVPSSSSPLAQIVVETWWFPPRGTQVAHL